MLISEYANSKHNGKYFAFHRMFDKAGAVVGVIITLLLLNVFDISIRKIFLFSIIPGLLGIYFLFFKVKNVKLKKESEDFSKVLKVSKTRLVIHFVKLFFVGFLTISFGLFFAYFVSAGIAPVAYLLLNLGGFLAFMFLGKYCDKFSKKNTNRNFIFMFCNIIFCFFKS
jgi:MFS family permease